MKEPTEKQKAFARRYLVDFNATKAYQEVYKVGYKAANANGTRMIVNDSIRFFLVGLQKKQQERTEVSADKVVLHLAKIAFANLKDFVEWGPNQIKIKPSDEVDGQLLSEVSESISKTGVNKHIKLKDGLRALELLGKHFGLFPDKQEITIKIEEVRTYIHNVILIVEKHIDNQDTKNRIAEDIARIGLN